MSRGFTQPRSQHGREVSGEALDPKEARILRAAEQPGGYLWPEIRIGRTALFDDMAYDSAADWNAFANSFAGLNKRRGTAYTLGAYECHYVTDTEMRSMILRKFSDIARNRRKAEDVYRNIRVSLKGYLEIEQGQSYRLDPQELCERPELMGRTHGINPHHIGGGRNFRATSLKVPDLETGGVNIYDGNKIGLDLSNNPQLFTERHDVLRYLRQEEGLDTGLVRKDWQPHVTIFQVYPHLRADDLNMRYPALPDTIDFGPVAV